MYADKRKQVLLLIPFVLVACNKRAPLAPVTHPDASADTHADRPIGDTTAETVDADNRTPCAKAIPLIKADLAMRLHISADAVGVVKIEEVTWPDGCLGVVQPELCSPNPVPGCRITLSAQGGNHEYHTNQDESFAYAGPSP